MPGPRVAGAVRAKVRVDQVGLLQGFAFTADSLDLESARRRRENHSDDMRPTRSPRDTSTLKQPPLAWRVESRTCVFSRNLHDGAGSLSSDLNP